MECEEPRRKADGPLGYINKITEDGKKYISPKYPEAEHIIWAFNQLAQGIFAIDQIRQLINKKGVKCERNNFWKLIRNPVYCAKILIPKYKDEEAQLVQAQHEPLISESLFNTVQKTLSNNKRGAESKTKAYSSGELLLRGFLTCPKCGRQLTGSLSRGKLGRYYPYYHCIAICGVRLKASTANEKFIDLLTGFKLDPRVNKLLEIIIEAVIENSSSANKTERKSIAAEINQLSSRLSKARDLMLDGAFDNFDYKSIKTETETKIYHLETKISDLAKSTIGEDVKQLVPNALASLSKLDLLFKEASIEHQRFIVGSIFPQKLIFDGFNYRTPKVNEALSYILLINRELEGQEIKKAEPKFSLSPLVVRRGLGLI
jgi:hypothetical protein